MTPLRLKVLMHYFLKKNNVTPKELANFFFSPSYKSIAGTFIQKEEKEGSFDKIYFKGIDTPLYYPNDLNRHSLHQVVVESFNPKNWHYYEVPETTVTTKDIVVDCGAAEGLFSLIVYKRCKKVYLIEPLPKFIESLRKTFESAANIEILPFAISDEEFTTKISSNDISSQLSEDGQGEEVNVTTLDQLFFTKGLPVTYLKLDLEGYDYKALLGAKETIKANKPKIAITTYHNKQHAQQIENYLRSIDPEYNILCKGIYQETGSPVMLHAWV